MKPIQILINAKDNASAVFTSLQAKIAAVGVAIASYFGIQAFAGVVKGAADFESAMSRVKAATGASADELKALSDLAKEVGSTSKFSSIEAADALAELGKAGLSAEQSMQALPAIVRAATADSVGLGRAADVVTSAIMGMGLQFTETGRVADVLAKGAGDTKTSIDTLGQALSYAAPAARSLGLSLESTVALVGQFAQGGIDASRAGTALNSILSQFGDPASKFRNELASAGIITNNFEDALHQLAAAGPRGSKAITAVGLEAGPALRAMLNLGMEGLDRLTEGLRNSEGAAAAMAKTTSDNLNSSMQSLGGVWQNLKDALGAPVLPFVREGVDQLAASMRGAINDGTIKNFGESLATAFQNGMKWIKEFVASVDFSAVLAKMQGWADETAQAMTRLSEWATNTGNAVSLAYNVMTAGANGVLTAIYGIGSVLAEVVGIVMTGAAKLREGLATVTFGGLSKSLAAVAEDARNVAQGFTDAAQAMRDKASESFQDMATRAEGATTAFTALATGATTGAAAVDAQSQALARVTAELTKTAEANATARAATEKKAKADADAKVSADLNRAGIELLRAEYKALVASGDLQGAAEKIQQINKALMGTKDAAKDATKEADAAAKAVQEAFDKLGITSSRTLSQQAENAKGYYETIKKSGESTAQDVANAFAKAAEASIAASKGVANEWVKANAAAAGYTVATDEAGKSVLKLTKEVERAGTTTASAGRAMAGSWDGVAGSVQQASAAVLEYNQRMKEKHGRPGEGDRNGISSRGEKLGDGVEEIGSGGHSFRNRDGMTSDARGNVQTQWLWTRSAIIDYLTEAGLDKLLAEDLAKQFTLADGSVAYEANDVQKRWAGKYGTLADALGKMADYYQYGDGKGEAAARTALLNGKPIIPGAPALTPAPAPGPNNSQFGVQRVVIDLRINGQGYGSMNTDTQGASTLQGFLGELERSARSAGR